MTGFHPTAVRANGHPSFGAVVSKLRGGGDGLPPFFSLRGQTAGTSPGLLAEMVRRMATVIGAGSPSPAPVE